MTTAHLSRQAEWIRPPEDYGDAVPVFLRDFHLTGELVSAELTVTAIGVYDASINGAAVTDSVLNPGWTCYDKRLQVQTFDVTGLLSEQNHIEILVGRGWYRSRMPWELYPRQARYREQPAGVIAALTVSYRDGRVETVSTDRQWRVRESGIRFSDLYDGEICDASFVGKETPAVCFCGPSNTLTEQEGPYIRTHERLAPTRIFTTPRGETVIDFGQEITGYPEFAFYGKAGEMVDVSFGEVLDRDGNFYNENYRSAKCICRYLCTEGKTTWHPRLTFYGFRYLRINAFPGGIAAVTKDAFRAVVVHSEMRRTGYITSSNPLLNRLFENCIWGQRGNFLDVPTDCPQRDERLGWTGDALAFTKTACLNFDTERFYEKWLNDLIAEQHEDGYVGYVIPDIIEAQTACAAWSDVATVVPWEVYLAYGSRALLRRQLPSMMKWVDYITRNTTTPYLWTGGNQNGDWLGLDAPQGSYMGSTRHDFIASAYYARSTELVIRAGHALDADVSSYEALYEKILHAFRKEYPTYTTQTECVLAARFGLAEDGQAAADQLDRMIRDNGGALQTGFVGTPHLLHALSMYGHTDTAYALLLREDFPSWLYSVKKGATTIWEHWDGIMENGDFWSPQMNSFNHYAYGSVMDWVYTVAGGIQTREDAPGYEKIRIAPIPDRRLEALSVSVETRRGTVSVDWHYEKDGIRYKIRTPSETELILGIERRICTAGDYDIFIPDHSDPV